MNVQSLYLYQLFNLSNSIIPFVDFQFNKQSNQIKTNQSTKSRT
jgi:hypothetical protein